MNFVDIKPGQTVVVTASGLIAEVVSKATANSQAVIKYQYGPNAGREDWFKPHHLNLLKDVQTPAPEPEGEVIDPKDIKTGDRFTLNGCYSFVAVENPRTTEHHGQTMIVARHTEEPYAGEETRIAVLPHDVFRKIAGTWRVDPGRVLIDPNGKTAFAVASMSFGGMGAAELDRMAHQIAATLNGEDLT